jgi:hypothetical protein
VQALVTPDDLSGIHFDTVLPTQTGGNGNRDGGPRVDVMFGPDDDDNSSNERYQAHRDHIRALLDHVVLAYPEANPDYIPEIWEQAELEDILGGRRVHDEETGQTVKFPVDDDDFEVGGAE